MRDGCLPSVRFIAGLAGITAKDLRDRKRATVFFSRPVELTAALKEVLQLTAGKADSKHQSLP